MDEHLKPKAVAEEMRALMLEEGMAEKYPAAVEYLAAVIDKIKPEEFFSSRERMTLQLQGLYAGNPYRNMPEVDLEIRAGNKVAAIKQFRAITGMSLKEAKDEVENRMASMGYQPRSPY